MFIKKTLVKKRLWHRCFPVNFVKFLRTPFLQNTSGRLLLFQSRWLKTFVCRETSSNCKWVKYFNQLLCSIFMNGWNTLINYFAVSLWSMIRPLVVYCIVLQMDYFIKGNSSKCHLIEPCRKCHIKYYKALRNYKFRKTPCKQGF